MRENHTALNRILQRSLGRARLNRKANLGEVEFSTKNPPSDNLDHLLAHRPELINLFLIPADETPISMCMLNPIIILPSRMYLRLRAITRLVALGVGVLVCGNLGECVRKFLPAWRRFFGPHFLGWGYYQKSMYANRIFKYIEITISIFYI